MLFRSSNNFFSISLLLFSFFIKIFRHPLHFFQQKVPMAFSIMISLPLYIMAILSEEFCLIFEYINYHIILHFIDFLLLKFLLHIFSYILIISLNNLVFRYFLNFIWTIVFINKIFLHILQMHIIINLVTNTLLKSDPLMQIF